MRTKRINRSYRQIYEQHHGPIPKGYHIHHVDGNHTNNNIENLRCITAKEHFDIHYEQGDYGSCWAMLRTGHLILTDEERSDIAKKQMQESKMKNILSSTMKKTNEILWSNTEFRKMQSDLCKERFTKLWSDEEYKNKVSSNISDSWNKENRRESQAIKMSTQVVEYNQREMTCPHCKKTGRGIGIMNRWHFDNCRMKGIK